MNDGPGETPPRFQSSNNQPGAIPGTAEVGKKHLTRQTRAEPVPTRKLTGYALVAAKVAGRTNFPPATNPWFRSKSIFIGDKLVVLCSIIT